MSGESDGPDERPLARRVWDILSQWSGDFPDHETALLAARRLRVEGIQVESVEVEVDGQLGEIVARLRDGTEVRFPGDGAPGAVRIEVDDEDLCLDDVPVLGCLECERIGRACPEHEEAE